MGRRERTESYFGKRVKTERESRKWSQAKMANVLSDTGIPMVHPTTIAKIEAGDRAVRIDEAAAIADVFGVSLDALLGRKGMEDDASHAMTTLADEAGQLMPVVTQVRERLRRAYAELQSQFAIAELEGRVRGGDKWNFKAPVEEQRALLMWHQREKALIDAADLLDCLGTVAKIRTMGGHEIRHRVNATYAVAAVSQGRVGKDRAGEDDHATKA